MPQVRALLANNCAWALCRIGDAASLDAADRWSTEAITTLPEHANALGTRGSVLIDRGDTVAGAALVRRALASHRDGPSRALSYAYLAIAAARQGESEEAGLMLRHAERADKDCSFLPRVRAEVSRRA